MALLDTGRVCRKTRGRDAGEFVVICEKTEGGFMVEGARSKRNKVAAAHLEPTDLIVSTKNVAKELEDNNLA